MSKNKYELSNDEWQLIIRLRDLDVHIHVDKENPHTKDIALVNSIETKLFISFKPARCKKCNNIDVFLDRGYCGSCAGEIKAYAMQNTTLFHGDYPY